MVSSKFPIEPVGSIQILKLWLWDGRKISLDLFF